jgi:hypothetical protein
MAQLPGLTGVVWEWTGEGGQHNTYACTPHEAAGMKGALVVGTPAQGTGIDWLETGLVGLAGAIVAAPYVASQLLARCNRDEGAPPRPDAGRPR